MKIKFLEVRKKVLFSTASYRGALKGWHYSKDKKDPRNWKEIIPGRETIIANDPAGIYFFNKFGSGYEQSLKLERHKCYRARIAFKNALDLDNVSIYESNHLLFLAIVYDLESTRRLTHYNLVELLTDVFANLDDEETLREFLESFEKKDLHKISFDQIVPFMDSGFISVNDFWNELTGTFDNSKQLTKFLISLGFDGIKNVFEPLYLADDEPQFVTFTLKNITWFKQKKCWWAVDQLEKVTIKEETENYNNWTELTDEQIKQEYEWEYLNKVVPIFGDVFEDLEEFKQAVIDAPVHTLTPELDSRVTNRSNTQSIEDLKDLVSAYQFPRDVDRIVKGYQENATIPYPLVIRHKRGLHLMAGNTRIDTAQIMGITPKVKVIDIRNKQ